MEVLLIDTIDFCRPYHYWENPKPYKDLKAAPAPDGCKAWITSLKGGKTHICWFKIQCHSQIGYGVATEQDIAHLRSVVDGWLSPVGLFLDDFKLFRIDYDYNFYMEHEESDVLMRTMQQLPSRNMRMKKWDEIQKPTVYYQCKSRHMQLYLKDEELREKGRAVSKAEECLCRQEVQCFSGRIKYMRKKYGLVRDWSNWVTPQMEAEYLTTAERIYTTGDFYTLKGAIDIIESSSLSPCSKKRLKEMLSIIQDETMDAVKKQFSHNTIKKYLDILKDLNVNPLTIKTNPVDNPCGITYIANPFFKGKGI